MVERMWFGDLGGGAFGCRVSKPTIDMNVAQAGDYLLDTSAIVYQKVLSGETTISNNVPAGTMNASVTLPSEYSGYSNLICWANLYMQTRYAFQSPVSGSVDRDDDLTASSLFTMKFGVDAGVLKFTATSEVAYPPGSDFSGNSWRSYLRTSWAVFNAKV